MTAPVASPSSKFARVFTRTLLICLFFCLVTSLFYVLIPYKIDLISLNHSDIHISDFAYHINLFKEFWFGGLGNIYSLDSQLLALTHLTGREAQRAMPVGMTPIAAIVWFPFSIVALFDLQLADALWVTVSVAVLFWGMWHAEKTACGGSARVFSLPGFTLKMILFLSSAMAGAVLQAQTSIFASGALLLLLCIVVDENAAGRKHRTLKISFLLLFLAIKPTYFLLGAGLALIFGQWYSFLSALTVVLATLGFLSLKMGAQWPIDYYRILKVYSSGQVPSVYDGILLQTMNTFSGAFESIIGRTQALSVSNVILVLGVIVIISAGVMASGGFTVSTRFPSGREFKFRLFIALMSTLLLFSPNLGSYEDVLLVVVLGAALVSGVRFRFGVVSSVYLVAVALAVNFSRFPLGRPLWPFWLAKAMVLGLTLLSINRAAHRAAKGPGLMNRKEMLRPE